MGLFGDIYKRHVALLFVWILLLGSFLRFYRIGEKGYWWDEIHTVELAMGSDFQRGLSPETLIDPAPQLNRPSSFLPAGSWLELLQKEPHPPLFYILMHYWLRLTGFPEDDGIKRIPSALFGVLIIFFIFMLGKELHSWQLGLMAAFLAALSPYEIYYSQELRSYTFFTMWVLLSYIGLLFLCRTNKWWAFGLLGASIACASYIHYLAFFILLSQGLYMWTSQKARPYRKRWAGTLFLAALLISLYIPRLLAGQLETPHPLWLKEGPLFWQLLESLFSLPVKLLFGPEVGELFYRLSRAQQFLWLLGGAGCALVWFGGLYRWASSGKAQWDSLWLLMCWTVVPVISLLGVDMIRHSVILSVSRYFALMSPAVILLVAMGLSGLRKWSRWILSLSLVSVMGLVLVLSYRDPVKQQDWRGLAAFLNSKADMQDLLVFNQIGRPQWVGPLNALCLTYYHGTEGHPVYLTGEALSSRTKKILGMRDRFWLIPQNRFFNEPGMPFKKDLHQEFEGIGTVAFYEKVL